ncbi:MAG: polyphosphate kinase 2 family protein [Planctomycetota bacterium]
MPKNKHQFDPSRFIVPGDNKLNLSKRSTKAGKELRDKTHGIESLAKDVSALQSAQEILYASGTHSVLLIFQGMDAAGKDGTIRHVMGAINPQGCRVYSFKAPNETELKHHFLWRPMRFLPERGMISIFNRSYYEEVLVVRVHPSFLIPQQLPGVDLEKKNSLNKLWKQRFEEINAFEQSLARSGTLVLKFFLHVSRDEQKERFLERLTNPEKFWKFNSADLSERALWSQYRRAFESALSATSTKHAPWFVIPADNKWYMRAVIADIIAAKLEGLKLNYPAVDKTESAQFADLAEKLRQED